MKCGPRPWGKVKGKSVDLIDDLHRIGIHPALMTSSRNAEAVLQAAGLAEAFEVVIDGTLAMARGLAGKPAADIFLAAAEDIGIDPNRTVVVEDAVSGVAAGRAGRFGLVICVAHHADEAALHAAGAHIVVSDLATSQSKPEMIQAGATRCPFTIAHSCPPLPPQIVHVRPGVGR